MAQRQMLLEKARDAGSSPGVYLMMDEKGEILYVGKAKNLRNRLQTYFQGALHEVARTEMMVSRVARFDVILTETEAEALILEATLIKKHKPKFNVRLKDDKAYPYIKIQVNEAFPRLEWTRRVQRDGARYFGPFPSAFSARQVMSLLNETFQLRDCSDNTFRHRSRPCILYQMGKCSGPCVALIDRAKYRESIDSVIGVLEGKTDKLISELRRGMEDAAEHEEYERAAEYRDQMRNLELVTSTQGALDAESQRDRDVVHVARKEADAHGTLLQIRGGKMVAVKHYNLQNTDASLSDSQVLFDFIAQYYAASQAEDASTPREILVPQAPEDCELIESTFGVGVRVAENPTEEQLLNVARANAEYALEQATRKTEGHGVQALEEVQEKLDLPKLPHRIECYDISNIQGEDAVASRVVFVDGAPDKNLYRRYKIRTVEGSNDFAMMKEVLGRRFSKTEEALPELVVVDGGKGQLSQAVAILEELGVQGVAVVGLAKARTERDFQAVEVKSSQERIFIPGRKNPVNLHPHHASYKLLVHVRDEAHRFAINYHRNLRSKRSLASGG
jgi:excinuclease ABC subunit C